MSSTPNQPAGAVPTPEQDPDFEVRHKKDLSATKFAGDVTFNALFPFLTGGAGFAAGYWGGLGHVATKVIPKKVVKGTAALETIGEGTWHAVGYLANRSGDFLAGNEQAKARALSEISGKLNTTPQKAAKVLEIIKSDADKNDKLVRVAEELGRELPKLPKTIKAVTAGVLGVIGLIGGGIAVGYKQWKKQESARLAAKEINADIARIELFRPSDPELLAENKRLSAMVAALPTVNPLSVESQGRIENQQLQNAL